MYLFLLPFSPLFVREDLSANPCLLIIQCDSGHINGDLIACARYRIYDMRVKALHNKSKCHITHVVFIVHLPVHISQSTFVGFQGDPWISCHIDQLRPSGENDITLEVAQGMSVSQIFYGGLEDVQFNRQISELSSNMEQMAFERLSSVEERVQEAMEEGETEETHSMDQGREEEIEVMGIESESGSHSAQRESAREESTEEPMGSSGSDEDLQQSSSSRAPPAAEDMHEVSGPTSLALERNIFSDKPGQCVRLNSCIQAAASGLQTSAQNSQRAAERVKLLIQLIPSQPIFPLGMFIHS